MKIATLRKEAPQWSWTAERVGFSWRYVGQRCQARCVVYSVGCLCGPSDDDVAVQWWVDDGQTSRLAALWLLAEGEQ